MNSSFFERGQQLGNFPPTNQRFSTHNGQVQRPMEIDKRKDSFNKCISFEFPEFGQRCSSPQVVVRIGVAAGA